MVQRITLAKPNEGIAGLRSIEAWLAKSMDPKLLALVKMRASQINGCAYCLHMHSKEALEHGEDVKRLLLLDAWHESSLYSAKERAALAWTESLTKIAKTHAPDDVYAEVRRYFGEDELLALSIGVAMINAWNRLAIGARAHHPDDTAMAA